MVLLISLLISALVGIISGFIMLKKEPENDSWFAPIIVGAFILGATISIINYETMPHNQFKTDIPPQVDTVITYTSSTKQIDTTYIYIFNE